jgi:hypothetical protein
LFADDRQAISTVRNHSCENPAEEIDVIVAVSSTAELQLSHAPEYKFGHLTFCHDVRLAMTNNLCSMPPSLSRLS